MADLGALRSQVVFWLKILLPLAALVLLSTLFLFSRNNGKDASGAFGEVDINDLAMRPRLTGPEYRGVTSDGGSVRITADEARPATETGGTATATNITAIYEREGSATTTATARHGEMAGTEDLLTLEGDVVVVTSDGYTLRSQKLLTALGAFKMTSDVPVQVDAPFGRINAGAMLLERRSEGDGHEVYIFNKGVRLIYDPKQQSPDPGP